LIRSYANLWYFKTHYRFGSEALLDLAMTNILYETQVKPILLLFGPFQF
jgi:hypothetical protein